MVQEDGALQLGALAYSGAEEFTISAGHTVSFWRYRPASRNGCPVPVVITIVVNYELK